MSKPLNPLWPKLSYSLIIFGLALASFSYQAAAESADRDKPIDLEADSVKVDDARQTSTYIGNVILTQGTLIIHADKLIVTEDSEGFQHSTSLGNPTTFKQKLEGKDEYMQGSAQRIEYDGRMDKVQLYTKAWVKRGEDIVHGDYIMYDANSEYAEVIGGGSKAEAAPGTPAGRVSAVIQPKNKTTTDPNTSKKPAASNATNKAPAVTNTPLTKDRRFSRSLNLSNDAN